MDVPGYDTVSHPIDAFLSDFPFDGFDAYIFIVRGKLRSADEIILKKIKSVRGRFVVARSFSEGLSQEERIAFQDDIKSRLELDAAERVIFFSNRTGDGIQKLKDLVVVSDPILAKGDKQLSGASWPQLFGGGLTAWPFVPEDTKSDNETSNENSREQEQEQAPTWMSARTPSAALADVIGAKKVPKSAAIAELWRYIKKEGLQDAHDKRSIKCDTKLFTIFKKQTISMFEIDKVITDNLT